MQEKTPKKALSDFQKISLHVALCTVVFIIFNHSRGFEIDSVLLLAMSIGAVLVPTLAALVVYLVFQKKHILVFIIPFWLITAFSILGNLGYSITGLKSELTPGQAKEAYDECLLSGMKGITGNGIKEVKRICRDKHLYFRDLSKDIVSKLTGSGDIGSDGHFYATLQTQVPDWEIISVSVNFYSKSNNTLLGTTELTVHYPIKPITNLWAPPPVDFSEILQDYLLTFGEKELFRSENKGPTEEFNWSIMSAKRRPSGYSK